DWDEDDQEWNWDEDPGNIEMDDDKTKLMAALINKEISISVWINGDPNQRRDDDMVVFEFCDDDYDDDIDGDANKTKVLAVVPTEPTDTGYVAFRAGLYPQDYLVYTEGNPKAWRGSWQHWVFIKDENEGKMYIYLNNELVAFKEDCNTVSLVNVKGKGDDADIKLGAWIDSGSSYHGRLDDFRIYNIHLDDTQIEGLFRGRGEVALAWSPSPYDGQGNVAYNTDLTWNPGDYTDVTDGHEVFFGTNYDEIAASNSTTVHPNVVHDTCSTTFFDPNLLDLGQTYYWRIDEVNDVPDACVYTGRIWSFTVAEFFIIEDFESYTNDGDLTNNGWEAVENCLPSLATEDEEWWVQPRGWKSLEYKGQTFQSPYYSEIQSKFVLDPNDWTILDNKMKLLTLWFYGLSYLDGVGDISPCTATEPPEGVHRRRTPAGPEQASEAPSRLWYGGAGCRSVHCRILGRYPAGSALLQSLDEETSSRSYRSRSLLRV
ncbi:MAG: LamG-like jellyroll fold domain-containing protein, partial [Planctomycetota bacterium]